MPHAPDDGRDDSRDGPPLRTAGRRRWIYGVLGLIGALLYALARLIPS